mmetsp:Transcript_53139/g.95363  ORF Transcript_53139/g.95363 Transcript_53139/m.95363 type:complete len:1752 (+) Transcript_53139:149-5404(+)|eukprot:CAMPEP_0197624170 /NCGR_PEP_ID=MMETSP1338-20131121/3920_1 /TAXON_ID=43686 ORGANISM="Pelagodinium beii, Strain RCC1491" /NCGR_SAMPLE_ID=MMETSP1338 /ASSEMBLY_ACC=CAM_ASM_000754 /LENGTH=1751 /DNA_ID=CAMNT_0043194273 /DNA_START=148 /DNA_END=5403 /DNA_ORIENTATION=-
MIQTAQSFDGRSPELRNVDAVLRDALEKIRATAPKRLKELRDEVEADFKRLDNLPSSGAGSADGFFGPLKMSCEASGVPKLAVIALEAIHKLISSGFLAGKGPDPFQPEPGRTLIDTVVEAVGNCAESADETVQMHMMSALLAAVSSQTCEVHRNTLMSAVNTCVSIHRDSKSASNQRMAQTALTQMLSVITQRMELSSADMSRRADDSAQGSFKPANSKATVASPAGQNPDLALMPKGELLNEWMHSYLNTKIDELVLKTGEAASSGVDGGAPPGKFGWCIICRNSAAHYCVDTRDPVCGRPCKFRNLERLQLVETYHGGGGDQANVPSVSSTSAGLPVPRSVSTASVPSASSEPRDSKPLNPYHEDAILVFNYLCQLSMKDVAQTQGETRAVRSKRIALELIHGMVQNCGPVFKSSTQFVELLKNLLCDSLIKNSVSPIPKIFGLSLQIFVVLMANFKEHLRNEIGVFIEQIFLRILESGNSAFPHKLKVLQVFEKLCNDATTALELFLNFDCDVDEKNIFERTIDCLSKIAQGKYASVEHSNLIQPHQEQELKILALQALVTLMGSIVDWARVQEPKSDSILSGIEEGKKEVIESDGEEDSKSEAASASASLGDKAANCFQEAKQRKLELQIGVNKFNMKPKRGIEYLKANGFLNDDPAALAELFKKKDLGLDKTAIGDYLGEPKDFNKNTLYHLVDNLDFVNQTLDDSLRHFLSFFRLPGEAQKIDRMMEKFAEKYCLDNPDRFANSDTAFVLSFAMIMLQTDLHNPGIKNKMTKEEFIRNNRGINDSQDLPREYLEALYDGVASNPISLQEDQEAKMRLEGAAAKDSAQKLDLFVRETENMVQKSQALMKEKVTKKSTNYVTVNSVDHVRPLFEVACWPYLATLAVLLEMQDAPQSVELCIEGFKACIRIAARFDMDTERDAFVSSLAKFTYLTTIKEMKPKNIECIKALLSIGLSEGNNLGPSWLYVLYCISQLERLQLIGTKGARQDFQFFQGEEEAGMSPNAAGQKPNASTAGHQVIKRRAHGLGVSALVSVGQDDRQVELVNGECVASQIDANQIEMLFTRSTGLTPSAVVHFVTQLAKVSKEELALADQPRIFSLQKLVEVADFNMNRMRVVWSRLWRELSRHFIEVAAHQNTRVSNFALDSLRQLTMKFLEKEELTGYNFQAEFLKPFETIMVSAVSKDVKDYVVQIIAYMTNASFKHIRSGWKTVFHICASTTSEAGAIEEATIQAAFEVVQKVTSDANYHLFAENFTDGVRTLLAFGQCKASLAMSDQAIKHLLKAADYLADPKTPDPPPPPTSSLTQGVGVQAAQPATAAEGGSHPAAHWFPILRGLSMLISDPRREVRASALSGVFDILRDHGRQVFDEDTWRMVFNGVIKPLFDDIHHQLLPENKDGSGEVPAQGSRPEGGASRASTMGPPTCLAALTHLVRLFDAHIDALAFLLDDVLRLIQNCIQHEFEAVARIGVEGFKQLLLLSGKKLKPESWQKVTRSILSLFRDSMPTKLMHVDVKAASQLPFSKDDVVIQCVVQLLLIDMLQDAGTQHYENIPPQGIMTLLDALKQSFEFAQEFNRQIELRQALKRLGFMREMKQLPGLLKQERESLSCSLKLLFQVQADPRMQDTEFAQQAVERLLNLCSSVLQNYASKEKLLQERAESPPPDMSAEGLRDREAATVEVEREVMGLVPIISEVVVKGLKDLPKEQFDKHVHDLFPLFCELTIVNSREVRVMVREVLLERITPLLSRN